MRDFHHPGRSTVHGTKGAGATSHPLATLTAIEMLRIGGNAMDAALAANAVLCVVEPMMTGIGGDCFALVSQAGDLPVHGLNGSGRAPQALSAAQLREQGLSEVPPHSVHAVTVPGAVAAWEALNTRFGTIPLGDLLQPAIRTAREGFVVSPRVGMDWLFLAPLLKGAAAEHFTVGGEAPKVGSLFKTQALGDTLSHIAKHGVRSFYDGPIADEMVETLQGLGGVHTREDFAACAPEWVTPLVSAYRGHDLYEIPPNGQGVTAQILLNILEGFEYAGIGADSAERYHRAIEAQRLAMDVRDSFVADPAHTPVPSKKLLSKDFAARLRHRIDPAKRTDELGAAWLDLSDTVYLTVVDHNRMAVSLINSVYQGFGSTLCTPNSAIMFQNRGAGFSLEEGHPNELEGGKRPKHTIIPAMLAKDGKPVLSFGVMGGEYQAMGHAHVVQNLVDFGMDLQEALDSPRVLDQMGQVQVENHLPAQTRAGLEAMGHTLTPALIPHGGAQAIAIDHDQGILTAASDPRKDGCALAY